MSTHQFKKLYAGPGSSQAPITSYFSPSGSTSISRTTAKDTNSLSCPPPDLPNHVQSNLLSVGMRVRKSVPEGYKTGDYSAFTLFSDPTPASASARQGMGPRSISTPSLGRTAGRPRARELMPLCGIMKIGGMAQQGPSADMDVGDYEDYVPFSSQESTDSNSSVASFGDGGAAANKRRFEEEDEEDEIDEIEEEVQRVMGQRVLAMPRRKRGFGAEGKGKGMVLGQENEGTMDFGEAEFLDYGILGEVEMRDV